VAVINGEPYLWRQIAAKIREDITSGQYKDGDPYLTGAEIAERFHVSQTTTVRRAVEQITREGLLTEGHGRRGRRVRLQKPLIFHATRTESAQRIAERRATGVDGWMADVSEQSRTPGQGISVAICEASPEVASRLGLHEGDPVVVRRRIRTVDGEPHNLNDTWYPETIAKGTPIMYPADVKQGTIALLEDLGYVQARYTDELTARMPTPEESSRLRIPEGIVPVMVHYRIGYTKDGPLKLTITVWPADRARIIYEFPA